MSRFTGVTLSAKEGFLEGATISNVDRDPATNLCGMVEIKDWSLIEGLNELADSLGEDEWLSAYASYSKGDEDIVEFWYFLATSGQELDCAIYVQLSSEAEAQVKNLIVSEVRDELRREKYKKYQLNWIKDKGYSLEDVLKQFYACAKEDGIESFADTMQLFSETGMKGSQIYSCYSEFCDEYHEYLDHEEDVCPVCGSVDVEFGEIDVIDEVVYYKATCKHCQATMEEDYRMEFIGFSCISEDNY